MKKKAWVFFLIMLVACAPAATPTPTSTPCPPCPTFAPTATPTPDPTLGRIYNPLKLEQEGVIYDEENGIRLALSITQVLRGNEAWQMIQEASVSNEPPSAGQEYLMTYVVAKYLEGPPGQSYKINTFDFNYLDERVRLLKKADTIIEPEARLGDVPPVYVDGIMEGWLAFVVPEGDDNLMVAFVLGDLGLGDLWFRLRRCGHWPVC